MNVDPLVFRNVNGSPTDPIETWPSSVFETILTRGSIHDHAPIIKEIRAHPYGAVAEKIERIINRMDSEECLSKGIMRTLLRINRAKQDGTLPDYFSQPVFKTMSAPPEHP